MKKLSMLLIVLLAFASCSKVDTTNPEPQADQSAAYVPHFYGAKMLDNPEPETRGVADGVKLWNSTVAQNLTVKFLNGTVAQQELVKATVKEWEKAGGVKFYFVESNQDAIIRVGFNTQGMLSSWAYTGTDQAKVTDQSKPTIHFAWNRTSDAAKRSDILRAFGQAIGLELEFRHPDFNPQWFTNANGTINEAALYEYWNDELKLNLEWADLKKMFLDPISSPSYFIKKTAAYDAKSVMVWPFYTQIANKLPIIEQDSDLNTELSEQDKVFVKSLYGEPVIIEVGLFLPLIEFEFTGTAPQFIVKTTKKLAVKWDAGVSQEYTVYDIPAGATTPQTITIKNTFATAKTRKIVISELVPVDQSLPTTSSALTLFDFQNASSAKNFKISNLNKALTCIRIVGVQDPSTQTFNFTDNTTIKELYLVKIANSKVILKNCANLETFSTSISLEQFKKQLGYSTGSAVSNTIASSKWPGYPETTYSLANSCLTINNCYNLKYIGLEHTRITDFNFSGLPNLEFVYLSSFANYLVGGGSAEYAYLTELVSTLNSRVGKTRGSLVVQKVVGGDATNPYKFSYANLSSTIESSLYAKNWDLFCVGASLDFDLVAETYPGRYRIYYRYLNPNISDLRFKSYYYMFFGENSESSDLAIHLTDGHSIDETNRPYYSVTLSGATSYRVFVEASTADIYDYVSGKYIDVKNADLPK